MSEDFNSGEFAIPGGVFISQNHCWISIDPDGSAKVGIDDFAKKLIGDVDDIDFPNLGMKANKGSVLFSIKQKNRTIPFIAPVSGVITKINSDLKEDIEKLQFTPYETNWICSIDADNLDNELKDLKIGKSAVTFYHNEIDNYTESILSIKEKDENIFDKKGLFESDLSELDDYNWKNITEKFFAR